MTKKISKTSNKKRCFWADGDDLLMREYHDHVWGVPKKNDRDIFEAIVLDAHQAGLSWKCILHKRDNFAKAFYNFDPAKIAKMTKGDITRLMKDEGIIRHRGKIEATIGNAKAYLQLQKEFGAASKYFWNYTNGKVISNKFKKHSEIPSTTKISEIMSKDLKKRGFKFTGPTMCYAFMQGIGMVDDHTRECFRAKK